MLLLARKVTESIIILLPSGENIIVKVVSLDRGTIKLGIDAPRHIQVHRQEVWEAILKGASEAPKAQ